MINDRKKLRLVLEHDAVANNRAGVKARFLGDEIWKWIVCYRKMDFFMSASKKTLLDQCHENPLLARALSFTTRLYLISKVINREDPPNLDDFENIPFEYRVDMILQHSIDYPGYNNMGIYVPDEYYEMSNEVSRTLERVERHNLSINNEEIEMFVNSNGDLINAQREFDCNSNNPFTIGETEFVTPSGEVW